MTNALKRFLQCLSNALPYPFYYLVFLLLLIMASQDVLIDDIKEHIINWAYINAQTNEIIRRLQDK